MPDMSYDEFRMRKDIWSSTELNGRLMTRDEVEAFDGFFAGEDASMYRDESFTRAQGGDFSRYEDTDPMLKSYLGAKKCYELYDRFNGNADHPELQQYLKSHLLEADLRIGLALGAKQEEAGEFFRACSQMANQQMFIQTLEEPDMAAKLRLQNQITREDPAHAQEKMQAALNSNLEQRVEMAKILFMNHLGKFQAYGQDRNPIAADENVAELYAHGGRTTFILPAGGDQNRVMSSIQGQNTAASGLKGRSFATHGVKPRKLDADGNITSEVKELKLGTMSAYSASRHKGMHAAIGGLGQVGPNGKLIAADGTNGHMYMHLAPGKDRVCGTMLVGFENAGPNKSGRLGHAHGPSAKKAGSSAFLSDKTTVGQERGGREVDLSGLTSQELAGLLTQFENGYREAAQAAQAGNPGMLDAYNALLTGKVMSVGQMKGLLESMNASAEMVGCVEKARAGHPRAAGYEGIAPEANPAIPVNPADVSERQAIRVTEFEGFARPQPPQPMKKPGFWDKVADFFSSRNSYVSRYEEYQRTLPERMNAYKESLADYYNTLNALEQGLNPRGLQDAYDRAVADTARQFGMEPPVRAARNPQAPVNRGASQGVIDRLETTLVGMIATMINDPDDPNAMQMNDKANNTLRDFIRDTESYQRLVRSGDAAINNVLDHQNLLDMHRDSVVQQILANNPDESIVEQNGHERNSVRSNENNERQQDQNIPNHSTF